MPNLPSAVTSIDWVVGGFIWLVVVGSLLHFVYEWSGKSVVVAMLAPVNESVWEHLKLGYTALILFMPIECRRTSVPTSSTYFLASTLGILAMNLFIVAFFYSYTSLTGHSILVLDISSFLVGAAICQSVVYHVRNGVIDPVPPYLGAGLLTFIGLLFVAFTFRPPHLPVFKDPLTGRYGI